MFVREEDLEVVLRLEAFREKLRAKALWAGYVLSELVADQVAASLWELAAHDVPSVEFPEYLLNQLNNRFEEYVRFILKGDLKELCVTD